MRLSMVFISIPVVIISAMIYPLLGVAAAVIGLLAFLIYAYLNQTEILLKMGKKNLALKTLNKKIDDNPNDLLAHVQRARLLYDRKKYSHAINDYNKVIESGYGKTVMLYTELAQIYFAMKQYKKALKTLEHAHAIDSTYHPMLAWLGIIHYTLRNFDEARIWWQYATGRYEKYKRLNGLNWIDPQTGWLDVKNRQAQTIVALLNAYE